MVATLTELGNMALQAVGEPRVMDINEPNNRAGRELSLSWVSVQGEVLSDWDWNFCRERTLLSKLSGKPPFKYKYWYQSPSDCVKVWSIDETYVRHGVNIDQMTNPYFSGTEFVVEGGKILTDKDVVTDLNIVSSVGLPVTYSKLVDNITLIPYWLVPVFYYRWAMAICEALTGDQSILGNVTTLYDKYLKKARANNAREGVSSRPQSYFLEVRE